MILFFKHITFWHIFVMLTYLNEKNILLNLKTNISLFFLDRTDLWCSSIQLSGTGWLNEGAYSENQKTVKSKSSLIFLLKKSNKDFVICNVETIENFFRNSWFENYKMLSWATFHNLRKRRRREFHCFLVTMWDHTGLRVAWN